MSVTIVAVTLNSVRLCLTSNLVNICYRTVNSDGLYWIHENDLIEASEAIYKQVDVKSPTLLSVVVL